MQTKTCNTFESCFYIGSRRNYTGPAFTKQELITAIQAYQEVHPSSLPVRVTDCCYVFKKGYCEEGWEVSAIEYPNNHQEAEKVHTFSLQLAEHLLNYFSQNRITIRPSQCVIPTDMLESDNPETQY